MKLTRSALALTVGALAPALLLATPALAAGQAAAAPAKVAAVTAGQSPYDTMTDAELRVEIARILATNPGKGVTREANKALDGTAADRTAFLNTGLRLAQAEDDRVAVGRILARPGISDALRAAAQKAVGGTPEELRYFITVGQYQV
ncbi:ALF repeat-containing protein [Streptomyces sp. NPDC097617]|uniref:ALF repeat-containing protein n=1 Tax=Streptomyces sp. NPDC097617 TaxID=3366091 RepID=UPI00380E7469